MSYFIWRQIKTAALGEFIPELLLAKHLRFTQKAVLCLLHASCSCLSIRPPHACIPQLAPTLPLFLFSFFPPPWFFFLFTCLIYFFPPHHHHIQRLIQYTCSIWSNLVNLNIPVKCNFKVSLTTFTGSHPIHQGFN